MYNENYNDLNTEKNRFNNRTIDPYNRDRKIYDNYYYRRYEQNDNNYNKSIKYNSPLKASSSLLMRPTKTKRFQNENLVVHRVSPYHYQYRSNFCDDIDYNNNNYERNKENGDQSYNVEKEKRYNQYLINQNINKRLNNSSNYENNTPEIIRNNNNKNHYNRYSESNSNDRFLINNNNYNNINDVNIKYRTPNNYNMGNNNEIRNLNGILQNQQTENNMNVNRNNFNENNYRNNNNYIKSNDMENINDDNRQIIRRNNSDSNYVNNIRYIEKERDKRNRQYYLKNPIDFYRGEEIDDGFRHYSPESNDYNGSRYGGYIYNYYLNAPMRGDRNEDWRFPPLYYFKPNYDSKRKIYTNQ